MNKYINQHEHNREFLIELTKKFPDRFFDWKITVLFYSATHLIRGYALAKHKVEIGESHTAVHNFLKEELSEDSKVFKAYRCIYRNCRDVRYSGFTTQENFEFFCGIKFKESTTCLGTIKAYLDSQGLNLGAN